MKRVLVRLVTTLILVTGISHLAFAAADGGSDIGSGTNPLQFGPLKFKLGKDNVLVKVCEDALSYRKKLIAELTGNISSELANKNSGPALMKLQNQLNIARKADIEADLITSSEAFDIKYANRFAGDDYKIFLNCNKAEIQSRITHIQSLDTGSVATITKSAATEKVSSLTVSRKTADPSLNIMSSDWKNKSLQISGTAKEIITLKFKTDKVMHPGLQENIEVTAQFNLVLGDVVHNDMNKEKTSFKDTLLVLNGAFRPHDLQYTTVGSGKINSAVSAASGQDFYQMTYFLYPISLTETFDGSSSFNDPQTVYGKQRNVRDIISSLQLLAQ